MAEVIARALHRHLERKIRASLVQDSEHRLFFRLEGFDPETYQAFLERADEDGIFSGTTLEIRSVRPVRGFEHLQIAEGHSATWYRNNLKTNHTLVLIFNEPTSDAQSLKDIYPITEGTLVYEVRDLAQAAITRQLYEEDFATLEAILGRIERIGVPKPQLRGLSAFLQQIDHHLKNNPGDGIKEAAAASLPELGLFAAPEIAKELGTARSDRPLKRNYDAALLGVEPLDQQDLDKYLARLQESPLSHTERDLIRRFLEEVIMDRQRLQAVYSIPWQKASLVFDKKAGKAKPEEQRQQLGTEVEKALEDSINDGVVPEAALDALQSLKSGHIPDAEALDELYDAAKGLVKKSLDRRLNRERAIPRQNTTEFVAGLVKLSADLVERFGDSEHDTRLVIEHVGTSVSTKVSGSDRDEQREAIEQEALTAFFVHYHGIEDVLSAVTLELDSLWNRHNELTARSLDTPADKIREASITFRIHLRDGDRAVSTSELIWHYDSTRTTALTVQHLIAEASRLRGGSSIPLYGTVGETRGGIDLDLYDPFETLGTWYEHPTDLWQDLEPRLQSRVPERTLRLANSTFDHLAKQWKTFVEAAQDSGVFRAGIEDLLEAYESSLRTIDQVVTSDVEASEVCSAFVKAWIVGEESFGTWAVVPFLHPLKLHWWLERAQKMNEFLASLMRASSTDLPIADVATFKSSLEGLLGSSGTPALLALPDRGNRSRFFLPVTEVDGYELFRPLDLAGLSFGLTDALVSPEEGADAARIASRELQKVLKDYLETFPFTGGGLDVYLFDCRNSSLPGLLIEGVRNLKNLDPVVHLVVHVEAGGAAMYEQVLAWQAGKDEDTASGSYLPKATVRVLTAAKDQVVGHVSDGDIVILADSLAHDGLEVHQDRVPRAASRAFHGHLPTFSSFVEPHQPSRLSRRVLLHDANNEPSMYQDFYRVQWMAMNKRHLSSEEGVQFRKEMTLTSAQQSLESLHRRFNWVVCYDATVDRHLIESTISSTVEVIRYSTGLGPRRRHNLTVSSASRTRDTVVRRLGSRLKDILPVVSMTDRGNVAAELVQDAKRISGDLILRAAGPGTFVNELIGVVATKRAVEQERPVSVDEIETWVSLDDFSHWFRRGKFPDLLRIRLSDLQAAMPTIELEVLEAKCVDSGGFDAEARDAERQVAIGVDRLQTVLSPLRNGEVHLDAPFWYDQLYQGLLSNLTVNVEQANLLRTFRQALLAGNFHLNVEGHTYAFCHNGVPASVSSSLGRRDGLVHPESLSQPLVTHHFSQSGLHDILVPNASPLRTKGSACQVPQASGPATIETDTPVSASDAPVADQDPSLASQGTGQAVPFEREDQQDRGQQDQNEPVGPTRGDEMATEGVSREVEKDATPTTSDLEWLVPLAADVERVISEYGIDIYPIDPKIADVGPTVTRFKVRPRPGERISKLQSIADDLVYRLALENAPIIEPVRGTPYVGIDLPSKKRKVIALEEVLPQLPDAGHGELPFIVGTAPNGKLVTANLAEAPHLLVGGATSSGKSVFLRSLLVCLLDAHNPHSLQLLIIDPKRTDFSFFNGLPHLIGDEVVTDPEKAKQLLLSLNGEMRRRQEIMQGRSMKVQDFNRRFPDEALPMITVVIDEYAQLVSLMSRNERNDFEQELMQVAAVARASGIHLILATQRPSADVVTGVLKANLPTSIAFRVATRTNSGIVIDTGGAENLLGQGDLLFKRASGDIQRLQAPYLSEERLAVILDRYK